ncbi:MAG: dipeptide epimerase [Bacteroidota bacterium]
MKALIQDFRVWTEDLALTRPYSISYKTVDAVQNAFVFIQTQDGQFGIGSGSPSHYVTGEHLHQTVDVLNASVEKLVKGKDIRTYKAILHEANTVLANRPAALAALDIALHDLYAKHLDLPLVEVLGRAHHSLPTSITIGIKSIEESLEEAREYRDRGFRIIKLKIGNSPEEDIEKLSALRKELGADFKIRVDANQGYDADQYIAFDKAVQHLDLEFYEQPFPTKQWTLMQDLPEDLRMRSAADEDLLNVRDAVLLGADPLPYGIYNIKLMKCGGINAALSIATIAHNRSIDLMWGCNDESLISITGALHAALASPATKYLDLDGSLDLAKDIATGGFVLKDGMMSTNDKPGLGIEYSK